MFGGLFGAKKVGGTSGRPKKEDGDLDDSLVEGPYGDFGVVDRKDTRGL